MLSGAESHVVKVRRFVVMAVSAIIRRSLTLLLRINCRDFSSSTCCHPRSRLSLLTALASKVIQPTPSVRLFPFCLENRLTVDLEHFRESRSRP